MIAGMVYVMLFTCFFATSHRVGESCFMSSAQIECCERNCP